jgi:hypothetical protein
MDDIARTLLEEIREGQRQALGEIEPDDLAPDCVTELVTAAVPRLLAALDGVLKAATNWQRYAADGDVLDECAREIRKVVARELASSTVTPGRDETEGVAFRQPDVHDERRRRAHLDGMNAVERAARDLIGIPDGI